MEVLTITSLLLTLLAHGVADFILQTQAMVLQKKQGRWRGYFTHGLTILLTSCFFLAGYRWRPVLQYTLSITLIHLLIDLLKWIISQNQLEMPWFLADQGLHLVSIGIIWNFFQSDLTESPAVNAIWSALGMPEAISVFSETFPRFNLNSMELLITAIMIVYICWGGGLFVQKFLALLNPSGKLGFNGPKETEHIGFWIGVLERLIILTLVVNNSLTAVAFIFTAKSIARFNELNDKTFAEYYLTGTLLSTALAVFGGFLLNRLIA